MSEHTKIIGKCDYLHLPYNEEHGFSYCKHCKEFCDRLEVTFNEGFFSHWIQVNCGKCHKVIWVCEFVNEDGTGGDGKMVFVKDDKKCEICGKPTNHYDCNSLSCFGLYKKGKDRYVCSEKCENDLEKIDNKLLKENKLKDKEKSKKKK